MTSSKSASHQDELVLPAVAGRGEDRQAMRVLAEFATRSAARRQRAVWSRRVGSWDQHGSAGLAAVIDAARVAPGALVQERPVAAEAWMAMFTAAGFTAITATPVIAE